MELRAWPLACLHLPLPLLLLQLRRAVRFLRTSSDLLSPACCVLSRLECGVVTRSFTGMLCAQALRLPPRLLQLRQRATKLLQLLLRRTELRSTPSKTGAASLSSCSIPSSRALRACDSSSDTDLFADFHSNTSRSKPFVNSAKVWKETGGKQAEQIFQAQASSSLRPTPARPLDGSPLWFRRSRSSRAAPPLPSALWPLPRLSLDPPPTAPPRSASASPTSAPSPCRAWKSHQSRSNSI